MYSYRHLHRDEQRQDVQLKHTYSSSVPILDVPRKTCQKQWTIGRSGERGSGRSVLMARHDDDDDDDLFKQTVTAIMMHYSDTKVKVGSPNGGTDFFDIVANTLTPYLFIIWSDYILRTSIDLLTENGFTLKQARKRYLAEFQTDSDYADDITLLANTPTQVESLLHSLEQLAGRIGLHVNEDKAEYMYFDWEERDISILNSESLKFVGKFTYPGSSVSSTESGINMCLTQVWTANDRLSIIWKFDLSNKSKRNLFQAVVDSILLYRSTTWTLPKCIKKI